MQFLNKNLKILRSPIWRSRSNLAPSTSSSAIRREFLEFFVQSNGHDFVRSSPVVPYCDPTVAFVNAGMNQFKNIFLGKSMSSLKRVANTQKCVRVGGKHNDLSVVGQDGYHHTFFEMMGNWSFGDYFKKDACEMAWKLLTGTYRINPDRLYVTYFAGDEKMGLGPDLECREIWRSLGIPEERILPFGACDNFWEMGATGPCGPCTEIHYDHREFGSGSEEYVRERAAHVNAGLPDLTEIWNLVFIQYNRDASGGIAELPMKHVDTGMGFERLVAVLQSRSSNYATDLFTPIFQQISKTARVPAYTDCYESNVLDTAYRIVADHSRMITACLADGMFPEQNHKLRRVIRKVFSLADRTFKYPELLHVTVPTTVAILGDTYPEMQRSLPAIQQILRHEHEVYRSLLANVADDMKSILAANPLLDENDCIDVAGFVPAYRELQSQRDQLTDRTLNGELMFKLYDTYGLPEDTIERLADVEGLQLDRAGFQDQLRQTRARTKSTFAGSTDDAIRSDINLDGLRHTENELKYNYRFNFAIREYYSPRIHVQVLAVHRVRNDDELLYDVVLDQSTFFPESGGQESDRGQMLKEKNKLVSSARVEHVRIGRGQVLVHRVQLPEPDWLRVDDTVELVVDGKQRTGCTLHHTATHLLNACVRHVTKAVCYQKSSSVGVNELKLELCLLGQKIDAQVIQEVQTMIEKIIETGVDLQVTGLEAHTLYQADNITRIPGEIYPERNIRVQTIEHPEYGHVSSEPCCGTHAINTRELEHFCVTNVRHTGRGAYALTAVAGRAAMVSNELGESVRRDIEVLERGTTPQVSARILQRMRLLTGKNTSKSTKNSIELPYLVRLECVQILTDAAKTTRETNKDSLRDFVDEEMRKIVEKNHVAPFLVCALPEVESTEPVPLQRATRMCFDRPVLVVSRLKHDGTIRARCCVPRVSATKRFGASQWLQVFAGVFDGQLAEPQKGQRAEEVAVMRARRVPADDYEALLANALRLADDFAQQNYASS